MDTVDYRYKDSIREALQSSDVSRLLELIPSMNQEEAQSYIDQWSRNYQDTMESIRAGLDTMFLDEKTHQILSTLMEKANLSGYHR